jgi:hypothetical protein
MIDNTTQDLIQRYLEQDLTNEELLVLSERIRLDDEVRSHYLEQAQMHAFLLEWAATEVGVEGARRDPILKPFERQPVRRPLVSFKNCAIATFAVAAALLFAVGGFLWIDSRSNSAKFGEITFASQASWGSEGLVPVRGRISNEKYHLSSGMVRIRTNEGPILTIAGPARFNFESSERVHLEQGKMTVRLKDPDATMEVETRSLSIRDIGTAFGVDADRSGNSFLSVFDGEVEVGHPGGEGFERVLAQGSSLRAELGANIFFESDFHNEPFADIWPLSIGINEASNLVRFIPPGPLLKPLIEYQSESKIMLFPEKQDVVLPEPITVDLRAGGTTWPYDQEEFVVPAGTIVSSHLIFFNPPKGGDQWLFRISGEVYFENPILGIIAKDRNLVPSDSILGIEEAQYGSFNLDGRRGPEAFDVQPPGRPVIEHDTIRIGEDRRSLFFNFNASVNLDQIRVIVAAD